MNPYGSYEEHQPVTWLRGHPIYAAHFIVLVYVVSMFVTTLVNFLDGAGLLGLLVFTSTDVLRGQVWRIVTYGLVNPPSLWFVIHMFMIVWFGREVEKFFGRRTFLRFYGCLYVLTPLLFTLIGLVQPMQLEGATGGFALFVAFATLYPNAVMLFNLLAKWVAIILVGIFSLIALSSRDLTELLSLWATTGFAFAFVRYEQGSLTLPKFRLRLPRRRPKLRVLPNPKTPPPPSPGASVDDSMAELDALLDKIARDGIDSLTDRERAQLNAARERMLKKR